MTSSPIATPAYGARYWSGAGSPAPATTTIVWSIAPCRPAIADDQLALAATDRDERVDGLDARLDRRVDALAGDDAGGDPLGRANLRRQDGSLVVEGATQRVHHPPQDDGADGLLGQVQGHSHHAAGEFQELGGERALEPAPHAGVDEAVTDADGQAADQLRVDRRADLDARSVPGPGPDALGDGREIGGL